MVAWGYGCKTKWTKKKKKLPTPQTECVQCKQPGPIWRTQTPQCERVVQVEFKNTVQEIYNPQGRSVVFVQTPFISWKKYSPKPLAKCLTCEWSDQMVGGTPSTTRRKPQSATPKFLRSSTQWAHTAGRAFAAADGPATSGYLWTTRRTKRRLIFVPTTSSKQYANVCLFSRKTFHGAIKTKNVTHPASLCQGHQY